ncbi:hypothetical protein [Yellowstone lake phycodnavirus 3]|uniref:hypothetical protein n=1 Tax=Yellowstone lake phycodnavirus 3 TaxID=1586715 RepID=UPI0006EBDE2E|nr:hypothetical protein AR677_gp148 [Yellowstone lake phycodnavirus 3]BAT22647.1 hypothetical protein [Yellowstone lake phycodnavirus 3]
MSCASFWGSDPSLRRAASSVANSSLDLVISNKFVELIYVSIAASTPQIERRLVGRAESLKKFRIPDDVLSNHGPEIGASADLCEILEFTIIILIIILAERNLGTLHLLFFVREPSDNVPMFYGSHWEIEDVHVIVIYHVDSVFNVPRFGSVRRKLEVGVGPPLQVYDTTCFFFEFSNRTPKWVIDLASATPAGHKSPLFVPPVMDDQKVLDIIHYAYGDCYRFVPLASPSRIRHCPLLILLDQKIYRDFPCVDCTKPERRDRAREASARVACYPLGVSKKRCSVVISRSG